MGGGKMRKDTYLCHLICNDDDDNDGDSGDGDNDDATVDMATMILLIADTTLMTVITMMRTTMITVIR
ncbi:unnamed protein product [Enterobius vermicularis]|uniref:Uncharacterized protein n=1 Tax=Enterobius vermicularis TaxID=51028 RepID=A0A0N4VCN8_ENTVE|nr:unnamed protein product [Enterobius vermicularis]